ncbi:hypothetical protein ACFLSI_05095 [Bacteroidota bacterium]
MNRKLLIIILFCIASCGLFAQSGTLKGKVTEKKTAKPPPKYFPIIELFSIGPEFIKGDIANTLGTGVRFSFAGLYIGSYKHPNFYLGFSFADWGKHVFNPTAAERKIMDSYMVEITKTNNLGVKTTKKEPLEKISLSRMSMSIPFGYQTINPDKKLSFFAQLVPTIYNFTSKLNKVEAKDKGDVAFGASFKAGLDYQIDDEWFLRLYYMIGTLPDIDLFFMNGVRPISGKGTFSTIQIGVGLRILDKSRL